MSFDTYQAVTDEIVAALERGVVPWHRPWCGGEPPSNLVSKKAYRGVNTLLLGLSPAADTPWWLTFRQAKQLGGCVRKGSRGSMVVFYKSLEVDDAGAKDGKRTIPLLRYYRVFNAAQCDGLEGQVPEPARGAAAGEAPVAAAQALIDEMPKAPPITHGGERAYYVPSEDRVQLPPVERFEAIRNYYATALHELVHSTGHESRLGRFDNTTDQHAFGSVSYGKEELVAELGAAFLCARAGVEHVQPSASYIDGWLRKIRSDRKLIVSAASKASAAADYIANV